MNGWGDAAKTMGNIDEKEVEFALYKNGGYLLLPVINGKAECPDYAAIIYFVFEKEEKWNFSYN